MATRESASCASTTPFVRAMPLGLCLLVFGCAQEQTQVPADAPPEPMVTCPSAAPVVDIVYPGDGDPHTEAFLRISGTRTGEGAVQVIIDDNPPLTAAGGSIWETTVELEPGAHTIEARAIGVGDCPDGSPVKHTVVQGRQVTLVQPPPHRQIELRLDRFALEELLPVAAQEQITLTELDLQALVLNALAALERPADWGWEPDWGDTERNLANLLVMSPDTADLAGTTLADVMNLSRQLGLAPAHILSDMLDLAPSEPFLASDVVAAVMIENLISSHPNWTGTLSVSLADGLADLEPLAARYGDMGEGNHPGFLAEPPTAELFTPAFAMIVRGTGNVDVLPGLRPGEGFASHIADSPPGTSLLELDFTSPEAFEIVGLAPEPRAGLTLEIGGPAGRFDCLDAGTPGCDNPVPPEPWTLHRIVGEASRRAFVGLYEGPQSWPYNLGAISEAATVNWLDGMVSVVVKADLGPPPASAFIWDMILDVAQARLRDTADGGSAPDDTPLAVRLALPPLPIGLTADGLIETMRPLLEAQKALLIELMVGTPDDLDNPATIWLTDAPALNVAESAPALFPSAAALAEGTGATRTVSLGADGQRFWTTSDDGETVVLDVGPWAGDHVVIGETIMPEAE